MSDKRLTVHDVAPWWTGADKTVYTMARKMELPVFEAREQVWFRRTNIDAWSRELTTAWREVGGGHA